MWLLRQNFKLLAILSYGITIMVFNITVIDNISILTPLSYPVFPFLRNGYIRRYFCSITITFTVNCDRKVVHYYYYNLDEYRRYNRQI